MWYELYLHFLFANICIFQVAFDFGFIFKLLVRRITFWFDGSDISLKLPHPYYIFEDWFDIFIFRFYNRYSSLFSSFLLHFEIVFRTSSKVSHCRNRLLSVLTLAFSSETRARSRPLLEFLTHFLVVYPLVLISSEGKSESMVKFLCEW